MKTSGIFISPVIQACWSNSWYTSNLSAADPATQNIQCPIKTPRHAMARNPDTGRKLIRGEGWALLGTLAPIGGVEAVRKCSTMTDQNCNMSDEAWRSGFHYIFSASETILLGFDGCVCVTRWKS